MRGDGEEATDQEDAFDRRSVEAGKERSWQTTRRSTNGGGSARQPAPEWSGQMVG